jgi:hypothetical protein
MSLTSIVNVLGGNAATTGGPADSRYVLKAGDTMTGELVVPNLKSQQGGAIYWASRSLMRSPSNGVITLSNNAETDFSRLQFGGTTSGFPALKRSGTTIQVRLADDSGVAGFVAGDTNVAVLSITNTVAAAVAVASTHKVTISIGGSTYYLLATNV